LAPGFLKSGVFIFRYFSKKFLLSCNYRLLRSSSMRTSANMFNQTILPHTDSFYRFALSIVKEPEVAKDVLQDCLAKIWKKREALGDIDNPQAWAFRIVKNHSLDVVRSSKPKMEISETKPLAGSDGADFDLLYQDQKKWLELSISALTEKQRQVYVLREIEEMSYQEISEITELTLSDVKVNLHRARLSIKSKLEQIDNHGV